MKILPSILFGLMFGSSVVLLAQEDGSKQAFPLHDAIRILTPQRNAVLYESSPSAPFDDSNDRLVFAGNATDTAWVLEVAFIDGDGISSGWSRAELHWHTGGMFWARVLISSRDQWSRVRFRIVDQGLRSTVSVKFHALDFITPAREEQFHPSPISNLAAASLDSIPSPSLVLRSTWGASPPNGSLVPHLPFRAAIHHTAINRVTTLAQGINEMKFIQDLHMNGNGWKDIGYHFCIDDSGRIYQATEVQYVASHVDNGNTGNVGIAFMGDFSVNQPTPLALQACSNLLAYLETQFPIQTDSVFGHRDYNPNTVCPGSAFYPLLPQLRNSVRQQVSFGAPYVKNPQPTPYSTTVDPGTSISFNLRDDGEGILTSSLVVTIGLANVQPVVQQIDPNEIKATFTPASPFQFSSTITVTVFANDQSTPSKSLLYHYQFKTKAQTIYNETLTENTISNATWTQTGSWTSTISDAILPELNDGVMIYARDSLADHSFEIHPNIVESGNYLISLAMPRQENGLNARYVVTNSLGVRKEEYVEYNRNFEKAWFQLGTSSVYFSSGSPSNASIALLPAPGFTTMMMVDALKLEKVDPLLPPAIPELKSVTINAQGKVEIRWYHTLEAGIKGFRLFKSMDGTTWSDTVVTEKVLTSADTSFAFAPPGGSGMLFFRIVAVDTMKTEDIGSGADYVLSEPSDIYGVTYGVSPRLLVVDNFDRVGSWGPAQHPFVRSFGLALWPYGVGWESAVNDAIESGDIALEQYDVVMYLCGDDSDRDESVSNIEQVRLLRYLQHGGKLFISGSEIGYDLARAGRPDAALYAQIFRASFQGDDSGIRSCTGAAATPFSGLTFTFGAVTADTYIEDFPDYIAPTGGSTTALFYENSTKVAGVTYTGTFGPNSTAPGRIVYFSFPFETIYPSESRRLAMKGVLDYLGIATQVSENPVNGVPREFRLEQNFPNPFNPETAISYQLSANSFVNLVIYDLLGRKIATLVEGQMNAGDHTVRWDGSHLAGGVYFYRIQAGEFTQMRKMVLVK
ncbi:MAG: N-acetylmuramoyl-L-alanine amidase [Bacteroidota bacterium]